jgi:CubicO group peptidase (beta-lactamase class C family)
MKSALLVASACLFLSSAALAGELATASPSEAGMSRLERITQFFKADTDAKRVPGAVVMIARHGKVVYYEAFGVRDPATGAPMRKDSIFRIYSMTKPITGVAVLILMEEGKLRLSDPISKYLPALKSPKVMVETVDAQGHRTTSTVPADREITVQDLLRHTSGITYGIGNSAAEQAMRDAGLGGQLAYSDAGKEPLSTRMTDQQLVEELGKLPLMFQPGTSWEYGRSIDVLLALVEKVSGQRADQFFQERIFGPLGMTDTFFNVPPDKLDRVAQPGPDPDTHETAKLTDVTKTRTFLGGGEGLLSTASDYMRFALMLANGGELDGTRLLSRKTVELMASDHLGPALSQGPRFAPGPGYGFGLTVTVRTQPGMAPYPGSVGEYNWGGAAGTAFWVDPKEQLVPIMLIQAPGQRLYYRLAFRGLVYQTISDRPESDQGIR